jgi:crossover junction endodeoxyribonuclease RusA
MTAITLTLPWPPATNNLFKNLPRGRARTDRYDAWIAQATAAVRAQGVRGLKGPFCISIECSPPDKRRRDLDGLAKAPLDLLVSTGVIEDDHLARRILLAWSEAPPSKPGFVSIIIRQAAVSPAVTAVAA